MGWNGKTNGDLLNLMTEYEFLITLDKGLYKQQNLENFHSQLFYFG